MSLLAAPFGPFFFLGSENRTGQLDDPWVQEDENTEFRLLRAYMAQNNIPPELGQKITQFLQYQYTLRQEARPGTFSDGLQAACGELPVFSFQGGLISFQF